MELEQTMKTLNALARGVHPATGEVFGPDSPYQHPDVVRALFEALRRIDASRPDSSSARKSQETAGNTFVRWTREEEERLAAEFDAGKSSAELARLHERSRAAIEARLLKMGKIDASALTVKLRYPPRSSGAIGADAI